MGDEARDLNDALTIPSQDTGTTESTNKDQTPSSAGATEQPQPQSESLAHSLLTRCRVLLSELDSFKTLLTETQRNPQIVEIRSLRSNILSELRTLEKLSAQLDEAVEAGLSAKLQAGNITDLDAASKSKLEAQITEEIRVAEESELRVLHALKSANLPFYEAVWTIAKRSCSGVVAFGKRFYWETEDKGQNSKGGNTGKGKNKDKRKSVLVDIVADDGEEWVKVSTVSETRLLFEMAEKGWEAESEDGNGEERTVLQNHDCGEDSDLDGDDDEIELLKLANDMRKAASLVRVDYRQPRLRFVIPKVEEEKTPEIDDLLNAIRSYGVTVNCGEDVFTSIPSTGGEPQPNGDAPAREEVRNLLPNHFKKFTPTLNVDCTILLAVISDLSHSKEITPSPKHHKAINRQIEIEREWPLLPTELWQAMKARDLLCTSEAAIRMREIVETIGTETERKRMAVLMGDQFAGGAKSASLLEELQKLSDYQVPADLKLPIKTVDAKAAMESEAKQAKLPLIAQELESILSNINGSVFMYGWVTGIMTITSNRTVVKQIEAMIESHRADENLETLQGPLIWVCDTARSLIGKEKGRKR
ncbi:hypothetical protein BJY04DRAFT_2382 [Aspergillus karnatakaensis]|uniref:uncharacterized protein n=1 Tax=Aspergillus karnatakaensis TaxID=1810916 RepID=UPI003CCD576C